MANVPRCTLASLRNGLLGVLSLLILGTCAGPRQAHNGAAAPRYAPRPPTCPLDLLHAAVPSVAAWDDLGVAEVTCHIDIGLEQCLRQFRAEACRMGGDFVYALPEKPLRPREQAVVFRGRVAHTRAPGAASPEIGTPSTTPAAPASETTGRP